MATRRSIRSKIAADDFIALAVLYITFQVGIGIWAAVGILRELPPSETMAVLMGVWIIALATKSDWLDDSRLFFRAIALLFLIVLWFFTSWTRTAVVELLRWVARFGQELNVPLLLRAAAVLGLFLGSYILYRAGTKAGKSTRQVVGDAKKKIDEILEDAAN